MDIPVRLPVLDTDAGLPPAFDWRSYVERYADLREAGVDSEEKAAEHYLAYGRAERRWATKPSYPTRRTLVCPSVHSLYLRATGDLVCWDDAGNDEVLQRYDPGVDYGHDVYLGPVMNAVRHSLSEERMPFEVCRRCLVLRSRTEHSSYHLDNRVIEIFQVEPSYKCSLDCPGCVPLHIRRLAPPRNLEVSKLAKILNDLVTAGIEIRAVDFQGHGEPLLHPGLWGMIRVTRAICPQSYLTVTTNAHGVVRDAVFESGVDEVVCAIDGVSQETYEPYRVGGRFELAYRFMSDLARGSKRRGSPIKVIWKYVLFEHNSTPENLLDAQRLAREAEVDEVVFVFTRNGPRSTTVLHPGDVPVAAQGVPLSFRHHEPPIEELVTRLEELRTELDAGRAGAQAQELASSVARNLVRFFPGRSALTPAHEELLEELLRLVPRLPWRKRTRIVREVWKLLPPRLRWLPRRALESVRNRLLAISGPLLGLLAYRPRAIARRAIASTQPGANILR